MNCPYCGADISGVYFSTQCSKCGKSLHTCKTCKFYDENAPYKCREHIEEPVQDKDRPNFCDYFSLTENKISKEDTSKKAEDIFNSFFNV